MQNTRSYLGNNRTRQRKENAIYHKIDMERAFLFGERNEDTTTTSAPRRYTRGAFKWITTNVVSSVDTLTEPELWSWAEDVFHHTAGSDTRVLFASPLVCTAIDLLAAGRLQTVPSDQTYGIAVKQLVTSHGTFMVVKHRLLENGAGGNGYAGSALAIEPSQLAYRPLQNSDTKLLIDRQAPGDDKWTDEYLTEAGLEFKLEKLHGEMAGVTG